MAYTLTVDGGGTKLIALLVDEGLNIVGRGRSGGINPNFLPLERIREHMRACVDEALRGFEGGIGTVYTSMPGPAQILVDYVREKAPGAQHVILGEGMMGLLAGACTDEGFAALAGTGSDVFYEGPAGHMAIGGWGMMLGDEGSGGYIGQRGLMSVIYAHEGRGPATLLSDLMFEWMDVPPGTRVERLLREKVYQNPSPRSVLASFAPYVSRAADAGDAIAIGIAEDAGRQLAWQMNALIKRVLAEDSGALSLPMTLCGGAWKGSRRIFDAYCGALTPDFPRENIQWPLFDAIAGGAVRAALNAGMDSASVRARMLDTFAEFRYPAR